MDLINFFQINQNVALAFSGGVDSAYLLYAALACGANVRAYYVKSAFQPQFELDDAQKMADLLHADMKILDVDVLSNPHITENPQNRCFYCKKMLFQRILQEAQKDGFSLVIDGTNASDDVKDRPGMRALAELCVRSPLREAGITKDEVRKLSKDAGLFTWNKAAYACLATRIPTGTAITAQKLEKTERAEDYLSTLGFSDFRVRMLGEAAKIQVREEQLQKVLAERAHIVAKLQEDYSEIFLDLKVSRH